MDCKTYLNKYRYTCEAIQRLEDKVESLTSVAERVTTMLTGMPGGGEHYTDDAWVAVMVCKEQYVQRLIASLAVKMEIEAFLDSVPGDRSQQLLRLRYADNLPWSKVAKEMHTSCRQVTRLHGTALEDARSVYKEEERCSD